MVGRLSRWYWIVGLLMTGWVGGAAQAASPGLTLALLYSSQTASIIFFSFVSLIPLGMLSLISSIILPGSLSSYSEIMSAIFCLLIFY